MRLKTMGQRAKSILLSSEQQEELEQGYKYGKANFSKRCHMILLKSQGRSAQSVADILLTNQLSVYRWIARYTSEGIQGLKTRTGQGRKTILVKKTDKQKVVEAMKTERQRVGLIKSKLEEELGKKFSRRTLQRFLKSISAAGSELG